MDSSISHSTVYEFSNIIIIIIIINVVVVVVVVVVVTYFYDKLTTWVPIPCTLYS